MVGACLPQKWLSFSPKAPYIFFIIIFFIKFGNILSVVVTRRKSSRDSITLFLRSFFRNLFIISDQHQRKRTGPDKIGLLFIEKNPQPNQVWNSIYEFNLARPNDSSTENIPHCTNNKYQNDPIQRIRTGCNPNWNINQKFKSKGLYSAKIWSN